MISHGNLKFRAIEREDIEWVLKHRNRPDLRRVYREYREMNKEMITEWFNNTQCGNDKFRNFIVVLGKRDIGLVGLNYIDWRNKTAEVNISIFDNTCYGKGYGKCMIEFILKYGFDELNLNRIWLEVYSNNNKVRFYEKCGFIIEGILRETYYHDGKYWNSIILSILKNEWVK